MDAFGPLPPFLYHFNLFLRIHHYTNFGKLSFLSVKGYNYKRKENSLEHYFRAMIRQQAALPQS